MDVIALGKATQALNKIRQLDESIVAALAEGRFPTVDARLDWLEGQADKIKAANSLQLDLSQGMFTDSEMVGGEIQLKSLDINSYTPSGTWESPIIDLGEGWMETKLIDIVSQIPAETSIGYEIATSEDGVAFTEYQVLDPSAPPDTRHIRIKVSLSSAPPPADQEIFQFNEADFPINDYIVANGNMSPNNPVVSRMTYATVNSVGIYSRAVDLNNFKELTRIEVI